MPGRAPGMPGRAPGWKEPGPGRGPPGPAPPGPAGPPGRGAKEPGPGRGPPAPAGAGRGAAGRGGMPGVEPPGRGGRPAGDDGRGGMPGTGPAAGRGAAGRAGRLPPSSGVMNGLLPGRGPGAAGRAGVAAAEPSAGPSAAGSAAGAGAAGDAGASGDAGTAAAGLGAAFLAGAGAGAAAAAAAWAGKASRTFRATGGSIVEEALLTNSPFSFNHSSSFLLSRPSSFASSWTRALPGTVLLHLKVGARGRSQACGGYCMAVLLIVRCSSRAHAVSTCSPTRWLTNVLQVLPHRSGVERYRDPEGPRERTAPVGEVDARWVGVHGGSSTRQATGGVDGEDTVHHDDTQQGWLGGSSPATHAGAHRARVLGRRRVYLARVSDPLLTPGAHRRGLTRGAPPRCRCGCRCASR